LVLSDNRPGHFNLSKGIVAAVSRLQPVEVSWLDTRRGSWPGPVVAGSINAGVPPRHLLKYVYGLNTADLPPSDLIVSAGAETLGANIAIARISKAPNLFYGSLRRFRAEDFALVLTSYPAVGQPPNVIQALKPSERDPGSSQRPKPADSVTTYGLLVGGNTNGITFRENDWAQLFALLRETNTKQSVQWIVSNSRRTPGAVSDQLHAMAAVPADRRPAVISEFIDVRHKGSGTLDAFFNQSSAVLCTADSSSMISETVWAQRPLVTVAPAQFRLTRNERTYREWIAAQGWMVQANLAGLRPEHLAQCLRQVDTKRTNPLDELAELIADNVPQLKPRH
jgi:mitochondrial fission protein ELM1